MFNDCKDCQHRMERVFEKCRPITWRNGLPFECALFTLKKENQNGKEISNGQSNTGSVIR